MANPFFGSSGYHVMCYSRSFKSGFIGTNVKSLENLFGYLDAFFKNDRQGRGRGDWKDGTHRQVGRPRHTAGRCS